MKTNQKVRIRITQKNLIVGLVMIILSVAAFFSTPNDLSKDEIDLSTAAILICGLMGLGFSMVSIIEWYTITQMDYMMVQEKIICPAIHFEDNINHAEQPTNIKTGFVVGGYNYGACFAVVNTYKMTSGFITTYNRFVTPKEAMIIALAAEQVIQGETKLRTTLSDIDLYNH